MTRSRVLLFVSCLLLLASPYLLPLALGSGVNNSPLGSLDFAHKSQCLDVLRGSPDYTTISLRPGVVTIDDHRVGFDVAKTFSIDGESSIMEEGVPTLPQVPGFYRIPNTGGVDLVIHNQDDFELLENVDVLPYQIEGSDHFGEARSPVYDRDEWYPPAPAEMSDPMIMRDFRLVRVVLYPVQVNPVTRQVRIYHNLQVEVVANDQPGINEITRYRQVTRSWVPLYRDLIDNLDDDALDDVTETPGTYLIMCKNHAQMREWVDSLRVWKTRKGFTVVVDSTHTGSASAMISQIHTAYSTWDPPLEFVALMGDPGTGGGTTFGVATDGANYDHTFALGNTGDDLEDIGVGRLSGESASQMATINAKIMGYERNPWMQNSQGQADTMWFHRGFYYAGTSHQGASNWLTIEWVAQQYRDFTGVDSTYLANTSGAVNPTLICNYVNLGVSFLIWRGGYAGEWGFSPSSCNATWRLPFWQLCTCFTNDFVGGVGQAEELLVAGSSTAPKGAVASIGTCTGGTNLPENLTIVGGTSYNIADLRQEYAGYCLAGAKMWLTKLWGPSSYSAQSFSRWNNLMGDPGLSLWTDVPTVMDVTHPNTLNVGARRVTIDVHDADNDLPIADAMVVLWKGTETMQRGQTDAQGHIEFPVTINTTGDLLLTVTKQNHKPYLYTIPCQAVPQMVTFSSYTLDDDNSGGTSGNANGLLNPGETIDVRLYLRNFGNSMTGTSVSATLASSNPHITVTSNTSTFSDLAPGDSALANTPFRISVSPAMQNGETALLNLTATASSVQTQSLVPLQCLAPEAMYISHQFAGTVNPGTTNNLQVTVRNIGILNMDGTTGQLISLSPFVQVDDASGTFGNIPSNQNGTNSSDQFTVSSNSLTFRGHQAPMRLILTTANGFVDTTQFVVSIGTATSTDPTGPDAYGYFAYDNTDASYEMHPTFNYVNISAGLGTDLNLEDIGVKTAISQLWSTVRPLPFHFTYYGQSFDTVTICSNGWMAFGNQGWNDLFRNYPIPSINSAENMVAPYWDDLKTDGANGVWDYSDEANHRYIVQWKAAGAFGSGSPLDFEVVLLDTSFYPTFDGNGQILFQYNDVVMGISGVGEEPNGCTIGIQNANATIGLQYAFLNTYTPGSASMVDGRAILFTTNARMLFGSVAGTVMDAATNLPLQDVNVSIDGYNYHTTTDASGHYLLDDVLIGTYVVRVHKRAFNDATVENVLVELDSTEIVDFSMLHPEFALSRDSIIVSIPEEPSQTAYEIQNGGNGPLDYSTTVTYGGSGSPDPWDYLDGIDISQATNDYLIQGCEFAADHWWVSGGNGPSLYKFTVHGDYDGSIQEPASGLGWFDLAFDGNYLYGSEQRGDYGLLTGIDLNGQVQTTIPSPVNPSRAIAYDPDTDHFWVGDMTAPIYELNRQGTVLQQISNLDTLSITGMAWYGGEPEGYKLLIFASRGNNSPTQLWKMHPVTHDFQLITTLNANPGEHAGGLAITPGYNSTLLVLGGILQGPSADRLGIYEVTFNTTWIDISPIQGTIPGNGTQEVTVTFDPTYLRTDVYRVNLNMHSNVLDTTYVLPVVLSVTSGVPDREDNVLPTNYALYQNYPNPFNPVTDIVFDLPRDGNVVLRVYNTLGQHIRTLTDGVLTAGTHRVTWDAHNDAGEAVAAGLYIYRLESGNFISARKMVLLR